jgi:hypothetical protein
MTNLWGRPRSGTPPLAFCDSIGNNRGEKEAQDERSDEKDGR